MERKFLLPDEILNAEHYVSKKKGSVITREGIPLEKGVSFSAARINKNLDLIKKYCWYWSVYPDRYLELITPVDSKFRLKFFQRIFLRACLRHGRILMIAPRAAGKSFICILALILIAIFRPHSHVFVCAPGKAQSAKMAQQKIKQLFDLFPPLKWEIITENYGADYVKLELRNGSILDIITPLNSSRGQRATFGVIDEYRLILKTHLYYSFQLRAI